MQEAKEDWKLKQLREPLWNSPLKGGNTGEAHVGTKCPHKECAQEDVSRIRGTTALAAMGNAKASHVGHLRAQNEK